MIKSFKHKGLQRFYETGSIQGINPAHKNKIRMRLAALNTAICIDDMNMHNPPHPGEFIKEVYLDALENISARFVAEKLHVAPSTFNRLLQGQSNISPEMALRLSKTLGRSPESWLAMQNNYNLYHAKNNFDFDKVEKLQAAL